MPTTIKEERLRWVLPVISKEVKLKDIAKVCPHSQRSLERWVALYKKFGENGLIPKSTRLNPILEKLPFELRKE